MNTAVLVLVAGASSRMGQPKMFLPYKGSTLLDHLLEAATAVSDPAFVVTGEHHAAIASALQGAPIHLIHHPQWQEGMGSSIAAGVTGILQAGYTPNEIILTVCDQPFVNGDLLHHLVITKYGSGKDLVACAYNNTIGTPALFDKKYFKALMALQGQPGAKKLLQQSPSEVATVDFPLGSIDIDTPEDYEQLVNLRI
ncbi:nucleotidyltransferase family protein [Paraflavitalea speifideaquila]|uniref:nucleotidyltransferase family protein n=1 Tax=Paraflavitalea speifideaquila TaxID=3076558 RepID=UPI0028EE0A94|nr:nucleotidyltransferase family protein [Paraflavitalea speifideiaquila]